jgi:hypothetical protein
MHGIYYFPSLLGLAIAASAFALWPHWKWARLKARFPARLHAADVRVLLGSPSRIIEAFPGPVTECWTYPPETKLEGKPIGVELVVDFDADGAVHTLRRLRRRPL